MHIVELLLGFIGLIDTTVQWGAGWRYVFSRRFRERVHTRWRSESRWAVVGELAVGSICFVAINALVLALAWRVCVGPIPSVHEWRG